VVQSSNQAYAIQAIVTEAPMSDARARHSHRTIIHLDLDAFFCSVEEQRDPTLRGKAFAVGGRPEARGVVASCSYAARQFGIHSAMPMARAVHQCPGLIVVPSNFPAYRAASQAVMERLHALTPLVEQISIDEAFCDVTALGQAGAELARALQRRISDELDLACSIGVASNKLVAKIATDVGKAAARTGRSPEAICVVPPGEEAAFLAHLPASALWGVGPRTAERLAQRGMHTIGAIAACAPAELEHMFGKHGADLAQRARGLDERPIETSREAKSISQETTYERDVSDRAVLERTLRQQAAQVASRLRRKGLTASTVKIKIRWPDFTTPTRQLTLPQPTDRDDEIAEAALTLLGQVWRAPQPVRLLGVGVSGLGAQPRQLTLWDASPADPERERRLRAAIDAVASRYGARLLRRASDMDEG
jgi:DNA polymerase-4